MSKINVNTWEPESSTALTMGATGDTTTVPSGASLVVASGATINITGATQTGFPTGGLLGLVVYTGDGTYTIGGTSNGTAGDEGNASVTKCIIECQAAGGGAADYAGTAFAYAGGNGGGGAYSKTFRSLTDITTITVVVPSGGARGGSGVAGGAASLTKASGSGTFATITCNGGSGGGAAAGTNYGSGGAGAAAPTTGDINIGGGSGRRGTGALDIVAGGSFMGIQSYMPTTDTVTGPASVGYGSGGMGGMGAESVGAAGGDALILIWEYA